ELRTPLHGILGFAQLGQRGVGTGSPARLAGYFDQIVDSGQRLEALLVDLLDIARLEVGRTSLRFETCDFVAIVAACVAEQAPAVEARRLRLTTSWPSPPLPLLSADRVRLGQVIINLLGNAVRYTPAGGSLAISVMPATLVDDRGQPRPGLRCEIADSGCGIAEDEFEHIFGAFTRGRGARDVSGGSGLGLAIARELVTLHGGHIDARNNPRGGATFGFTIPFAPPSAPAA
ncbi:MAG: HAMP domain-containing sensor histidine kinase, partial [Gammaproteobacteria bacterium]